MTQTAAQPIRETLVDGSQYITRAWRNYLFSVQNVANTASQVLRSITLSGQSASIFPTPIPIGTITAGFYQVSVYELVTVSAPASSLTVTIGWTDAGLACTRVVPALVNGLAGANTSLVFPIHCDNDSPITYQVAYASTPAGLMVYALGVLVEAL